MYTRMVVGLGNPGKTYEMTRHNVGYMVVDALVQAMGGTEQWGQSNKFEAQLVTTGEILCVKPSTYMNKSGLAVGKLVRFYGVETDQIWVIHDDLDMVLGSYKIQLAKGPKVHGGLQSIERELGTSDFWRVRVGVDNRQGERVIPGDAYVLSGFGMDEYEQLKRIIEQVVGELGENYLGIF